MSEKSLVAWQQIREVYVGTWKTGWMVKNIGGDVKLMVVVDKERYRKNEGYGIKQREEKIGASQPGTFLKDKYDAESAEFVTAMSHFVGLTHANILHIEELTTDEKNQPVAIMEYPFGDEITTALENAPIETFVAHFKQLFEALAFIHKLGIFHLHLSPRFIITDLIEGVTKITDCWHVHTKEDVAKKLIRFAPMHVAPEIILDGKADERSDLYSAALIMREAWSGRRSQSQWLRIECKDIDELRTQIQKEKDPWTAAMSNDMERKPPTNLDKLMVSLLKKNPEERGFRSAQEIVNYIIDLWPNAAKPTKELYGEIMTTNRL